MLSRDSVGRIALLAPAVCASQDPRPALSTARDGIDVFYSNNDRIILDGGRRLPPSGGR
jgi:hypothetical protein